MKSKKIVQEYPEKAWEKESAYTWTSWKRDEDNKSAIHARQGQRVYPRRKGDRNKSLHIDMPMKKRGKQRKVGCTKTSDIKGKLKFRRMDEEAKLGTYRQNTHVPSEKG